MRYKLIIFDVDGTLAEIYTLNILPGVKPFFDLVFQDGCPNAPQIAIATNQGGVGLRRWMEAEGFGKPGKYPLQREIEDRLENLVEILAGQDAFPAYVSFSYQNKRGRWSPVPPESREDIRWTPEWRKPQPGMLLHAMQEAGVGPEETLYVGDRRDDQHAAQAAKCSFTWAEDFFGKNWKDCTALEEMDGLAAAAPEER